MKLQTIFIFVAASCVLGAQAPLEELLLVEGKLPTDKPVATQTLAPSCDQPIVPPTSTGQLVVPTNVAHLLSATWSDPNAAGRTCQSAMSYAFPACATDPCPVYTLFGRAVVGVAKGAWSDPGVPTLTTARSVEAATVTFAAKTATLTVAANAGPDGTRTGWRFQAQRNTGSGWVSHGTADSNGADGYGPRTATMACPSTIQIRVLWTKAGVTTEEAEPPQKCG